MATAKYTGPEAALERYERAVSALEGVDRKGAKNPYTSRNGHMFSFLDQGGTLAIRLSDEDLQEFRGTYESGPSIQYGSTMRGYSTVPDELLEDTDAVVAWLKRSHDWIGTLPPKPTKKA